MDLRFYWLKMLSSKFWFSQYPLLWVSCRSFTTFKVTSVILQYNCTVAPGIHVPTKVSLGAKPKAKNENKDRICLTFSRRFWNLWPKPDTAAKFQNLKPTNTLNTTRICQWCLHSWWNWSKNTQILGYFGQNPHKSTLPKIYFVSIFYVFFGQVTESKDQNAPGFLPQPSNTIVIVASNLSVSQVLQPY